MYSRVNEIDKVFFMSFTNTINIIGMFLLVEVVVHWMTKWIAHVSKEFSWVYCDFPFHK